MKQSLVSILICAYNAEATIKETLESCINQTYKNIEILIHDDKSRDKTLEIIRNFEDKRIKIVESWKKLWPYKWLNFLIDNCNGDYIAIQDHDDIWHPQKLAKQVKFLEDNQKYVGCWTKTFIWYEWDNKWYQYYLGDECYFTIHPSLVFRNNWYRYIEDKVYMADAYFQKNVLCRWEKKIANINELLTIHRVKKGADNYTYKRFKLTKKNLSTLFSIYSLTGWICVIIFELMRKIIYPIFHRLKKWSYIDKIERIPFVLRWYKIKVFDREKFQLLEY